MLTSVQLTALQTNLAGNANTISISGTPVAINALTASQKTNSNIAQEVADWYNLNPATAFYGYYGTVPVDSIRGSIRWARLTPSDAVTATNYTQISLACQGFQFNVQLLLGLNTTLNAAQRAVIQGFHDSLAAVPSAGAGATQDAGWTTAISGGLTLPQVLSRSATNAEALFADTTAWGQGGSGASQTPGATGPALLVFEGQLSGIDIQAGWNGHY